MNAFSINGKSAIVSDLEDISSAQRSVDLYEGIFGTDINSIRFILAAANLLRYDVSLPFQIQETQVRVEKCAQRPKVRVENRPIIP